MSVYRSSDWPAAPLLNTIYNCDAMEMLESLPDESVNCVVTSPPYYGLRDYGIAGQMGMEPTLKEYIAGMVALFHEIKRVLRSDGVLWLNMGDAYATSANGRSAADTKSLGNDDRTFRDKPFSTIGNGLKPKDLMGQPWRLAFALQEDGWYLRSDCIWHKPNPMPASVKDRPTTAHEYMFLMTKSERYYFDPVPMQTPVKEHSIKRLGRAVSTTHKNIDGAPGQTPHSMNRARPNKQDALGKRQYTGFNERYDGQETPMAHPRTVWTIPTVGFEEGHFACVDSKTEALTKTGWKTNDQIKDGESIAAYDKDLGVLTWQPASIHRYPYNGQLITIDKRDTSQHLTPNHRCLIRRVQKDKSYKEDVVRADELKPKSEIMISAPFEDNLSPEIGVDWAALVGWYITEGENVYPGYVVINQSLSANPNHVETIRNLLIKVNAEYKERIREREWRGRPSVEVIFTVTGEAAIKLQSLAPCKEVTPELANLRFEEGNVLLQTLIDGDGHRRKDGRACIVQKNFGSISMMQFLAVKCGYRAIVSKRGDGGHVLYLTKGRWLTLRGTNGAHKAIPTEKYEGIVWCPSVESGFWLARRDGKPFITGNTFPEDLIRPLIAAGCPEMVCECCGKPWIREVESISASSDNARAWQGIPSFKPPHRDSDFFPKKLGSMGTPERIDKGFHPSCNCGTGTTAGVVYDPFMGSGTTALVTRSLGRNYIGSELNPEYIDIAKRRLKKPFEKVPPKKDVVVPTPSITVTTSEGDITLQQMEFTL